MSGFVQSPCTRCGAPVWIAQNTGVGFCARCQQYHSAPVAAASHSSSPPGPAWLVRPPPGAFTAPPVPQNLGSIPPPPASSLLPPTPDVDRSVRWMRRVAVGLGVTVVCLAFGIAGYAARGGFRRGHDPLARYDVDPAAASPDRLLQIAGEIAQRWEPDARFHGITLRGLTVRGVVDLTRREHSVTVEYFSPARVTSAQESDRRASIKRVIFNADGVHYERTFGVPARVGVAFATTLPVCTTRRLAAKLSSEGMPPSAEFRVSYIPDGFGAVGDVWWRVVSDRPRVDRLYDAGDCYPMRSR